MKRFFIILLIICLTITGLSACGDKAAPDETPDETQTENPEKAIFAPDFTAIDGTGSPVTLSDYKGNVIFLNFWGTWCPPCRAEMPEIQKVYEKYKDQNVVILAVNVQTQPREKSIRGVEAWVEEQGYTFPIIYDEDGTISALYRIQAFPTTFVIDAEGQIRYHVVSALNETYMSNMIDAALEPAE